MNAKRITQLLKTLEDDHDMDPGFAEQGVEEDSVLLRSDDERLEVVLRFEEETWKVRYETQEPDAYHIVVEIEGEGFGDDHVCDLTDTIEQIANFTNNLGI